jgi:hypothetical protein
MVQTKRAIRRPDVYSPIHTEDFMGPRFLKVSNGVMSESGMVQAISKCEQSVSYYLPDMLMYAVVAHYAPNWTVDRKIKSSCVP